MIQSNCSEDMKAEFRLKYQEMGSNGANNFCKHCRFNAHHKTTYVVPG